MATIKGQNLRVMVVAGQYATEPRCVAAARSCTAHASLQVEDCSTKDDVDDWVRNEPVGISWDLQVESLIMEESDNIKLTNLQVGQKYLVKFARTSGEKNRESEESEVNFVGWAILSDFQIQSQNRQAVVVTAQFTGSGDLAQVTSIKEWVNSHAYMIYKGIAIFDRQGVHYAVAVAESYYGSNDILFPVAHNGIFVTCSNDVGYVTGLADIPGYDVEDTFNALREWAVNAGYNMYSTIEEAVYDYNEELGTFIIGQQYLGVLQPIN